MDNQGKLITKIEEFSLSSICSLKRLRDECLNDLPLLLFHDKIVDLYINNITVLYNLNGFLEKLNGKEPFLTVSDLQDPCYFVRQLDNFIGNCLLDDGSYYCTWQKLDKKKQVLSNQELLLPYTDKNGKFVKISCYPFDPDGDPIIIADYSGGKGNQDVVYLNKVVNFAINRNKKQNQKIKEWERRRDAK